MGTSTATRAETRPRKSTQSRAAQQRPNQQRQQSARTRIHSRPPTGQVSHPCILVEGEEKAGKTWVAYELSKSERIGDAFAIDLGEGSADEYAPIGSYEVLMADPDNPLAPWTFTTLLEQVAAVRDYAREQLEAGEKPVLLSIDTMSDEWGVLVDAITAKAAKSERNRRALAEDPAAEVKVPNHLWNDANAKHRRLMTMLLTFPGIVVVTARGKEVAEIRNGAPVEGSKVWKVEGQKNLPFDVSAWIRMKRNAEPTLEGARSVYVGLRPGIDAARDLRDVAGELDMPRSSFRDRGLEWFIFDALRYDPATAKVRDLRDMTDDGEGLDAGQQPGQTVDQVFARVQAAWNHPDGLRILHREILGRGYADAVVRGPDGQDHPFAELVAARGRELVAQRDGRQAPQEPQDGPQEPPDPDDGADGQPGPDADAEALAQAAAEAAEQAELLGVDQ